MCPSPRWPAVNNWFAHPSPDGKWLVFVTFEKDVEVHPANKDVMLRLMPAGDTHVHKAQCFQHPMFMACGDRKSVV